ncbi:MAG TPA: hypothetical protein VER33_03900 [Polyangiaceae bacterium]|nr:hypothetical protein [Polyangiaceae bacterium]
MAAHRPCTDPIAATYACLVQQPVASWECAENGVAAIREGFCEGEQARTVACLQAQVRD